MSVLAPTTINAKVLLQSLWKSNFSWVKRLDETHSKTYAEFTELLERTKAISIAIHLKSAENVIERQLCCSVADAGVGGRLLNLIVALLRENRVSLEDETGVLPHFVQRTGVAQGDNLSPQLFTALLSDLPQHIFERHDLVICAPYADDLALWSRSRGTSSVPWGRSNSTRRRMA